MFSIDRGLILIAKIKKTSPSASVSHIIERKRRTESNPKSGWRQVLNRHITAIDTHRGEALTSPAFVPNWDKMPPPRQSLTDLVTGQLEDQKAENIVIIDLAGKSSMADEMVIASGRSERHVGALAELLMRVMKNHGYGRVAIEGTQLCDWVLLDAGDLIVHIFRPETRALYNLERLWSNDTHGGPA